MFSQRPLQRLPLTGCALSRPRQVTGHVVFVGAHPDDEVLAAPLLHLLCVHRHVSCTFVSATAGERGPCYLPEGCIPDIAAVRRSEFSAAAALYGADPVLLELRDGCGTTPWEVLACWYSQFETEAMLREYIAAEIRTHVPTLLIALDPERGGTCHPDRRAIGMLVDELARARGWPVIYVRTRVTVADGFLAFFPPARSDVRVLNAAPVWTFVVRHAATYPSQFHASMRSLLEHMPLEQRFLYYRGLGAIGLNDACEPP